MLSTACSERPSVCTEVTKHFMNLPIAYEFYVRDDLIVTSVKVTHAVFARPVVVIKMANDFCRLVGAQNAQPIAAGVQGHDRRVRLDGRRDATGDIPEGGRDQSGNWLSGNIQYARRSGKDLRIRKNAVR